MNIQHIYREEDEFCGYNRGIFKKLKLQFPDLAVEEFLFDSPEGRELAKKFNITIFPATIIDGKFYTSGGVDEKELIKLLQQ